MGKGYGKGGADKTLDVMRIFVIILNIFTSLAGLALIGLGIYALLRSDLLLAGKTVPITMIVAGALVFVVSFVGCVGAGVENKNMLTIYFLVLMVLVLSQIVTALYTVSNTDKVEDSLDHTWQKAYDNHPRIIRNIESEYLCCGFRNTTDRAIPKSRPDACTQSPLFGYDQPCLAQLREAYEDHQRDLAMTGMILGVVQLLALIAAYILMMRLPSERQREHQYLDEHRRLVEQGRGRRSEESDVAPATYGSTGADAPAAKTADPLIPSK